MRDKKSRISRLIEAVQIFEFSFGGFGEQNIFLFLPLYFILFRFLVVHEPSGALELDLFLFVSSTNINLLSQIILCRNGSS